MSERHLFQITPINRPVFVASLLFIIFLVLLHLQAYPQGKEANIWYFGNKAGVDFNQGSPPVALLNSQMTTTSGNCSGTASIADSSGNLFFYSNGVDIWNKNHGPMQNGQDMGDNSSQGAMIVPKPDNNQLYYYFNIGWDANAWQYFFQYSLIDMDMDNGLGAVVDSLKGILLFPNSSFHLSAVSHANGSDVWVLAHKYYSDYYYAYLVTSDSLHHTPVISQAGSVFDVSSGYMKISPNGKKVASAIDLSGFFDLMDFDNETGMVNDDNLVHNTGISDYYGVEFSPDNSKLYLNGINNLVQYDLNAGSPQEILESEVVIFNATPGGALQLAPDGKIYCSMGGPYLSVIHQPNNVGVFCDFEHDAINLEGRLTTGGLPSFIQSYLNDPTFTTQNNCVGDATTFEITETNGIDSVFWDFNDFPNQPYDTSTLFNPSYTFSHAGTFFVDLTVYSGLLEKTVTQEVIIHPLPEPNLGPDTTICNGQEIVLDAECGPHSYSWSTGQFGISQIIVSDSGWYWVRVQSEAGCFAFDSIYVGCFPPAVIDTQNLEIIPTTCGGSMGVIRGLTVSGNPPFQYQWVDDIGNPIANTIDIFHLPVGNYTLQVTDGNDCLTEFGPYTIYDAGDVLIQEVNYTQEHCGQQDGSIIITATSGLGTMLFYSIDNGSTYYTNQGIFMGLSSGTYAVRVKDSTDCQDVYINNPIILENIPGPQVTDVQITPASIGQNDGTINIIASGNSDTLFYSNDNGANFQINDGLFTYLFPGFYTCIVMDEYDCDTTFIVEVTEEITIHLEAIAGDDEVCPGNAAYVPLIVNQFNDVATFRAILLFNKNLLECQGFANAHPQLEDSLNALLFPAEGKIELNWASSSLTLPDGSVMADLVFSSLNPGISQVEWDGEPGASFFLNQEAQQIPVDYYVGNVKIYKEVTLSLNSVVEACQGEQVFLTPIVLSSNGEVTYLWTNPSGDTSSYFIYRLNNIQPNQSGIYYLTVVDTANCQADTSVDVIVYPTPIPAFAGQDTIFTEDPVDLDAGAGFLYYLWNTGDSTQIITVDKNGWYAVEIESQQGCMGGDSVFVLFSTPPEPIPDIRIYLPNAFSPNGDGLNDEFKAVTNSENIESFQMLIYDRWGTLIFESKNISFGWNGTFKGKLCPQGVYVYKIEYSFFASSTGQAETKIGTVVLVR